MDRRLCICALRREELLFDYQNKVWKNGFNISSHKIYDMINKKGKIRRSLHTSEEYVKNAYPTKVRLPLII